MNAVKRSADNDSRLAAVTYLIGTLGVARRTRHTPWILRSIISVSVGHGEWERKAHQVHNFTSNLLANLFSVEYYRLPYGITWQLKKTFN